MSLEKVGRYEIIGELGRGAMGVVYKAKDPTIGRTVALKTMRLDVHGLEAEDMLRRFRNEARAAGLLSHPNIVTIYDAGEADGIFYIAMEFIQGTTLQAVLAEKHILATDEAIQLSRQICKGLDYAHSHNIIHRDVKPANIMITANGTVKIMDFGIAKSGGSLTSTGQVLGTPNYMSPEQVKGRPLDGRSDLWSFGVILYEMLTGEKPFMGQNVTTIIYKIVNENPIAPRDLDVTVHPGLSAIVVTMLAKSPDERFQTGADLIHALETYKSVAHAGQSASAAPNSSGSILSSLVPVSNAHEKTLVLPVKVVSGSTLRVTEAEPIDYPSTPKAGAPGTIPTRGPVVVRRRPAQAHSGRNRMFFAALAMVLLLGLVMGGYAYHRTQLKIHQLATVHADVTRLSTKPAQTSAQQPQTIAQPLSQQASASATPVATASVISGKTSKTSDEEIAPDTTVKFIAYNNPAKHVPRPKTIKKAVTSPNNNFNEQSEVQFASNPAGAKVEVDGWSEPTWVTPFTASHLTAGWHSIVLTKEGYLPQSLWVESAAGKSVPVSAELKASLSTLVVTSNPSGATVFIDGKDSGFTTPAQLTVEKGTHRVALRKAGFKEASTQETLSEGQTATFAPVLLSVMPQPEDGHSPTFLRRMLGTDTVPDGKGLVHIRTNPEGASIFIDGRLAPKKSNARWPADPGVYSIVLEKEGYKPVHRNIRVQEGKIVPIDEILEKQ